MLLPFSVKIATGLPVSSRIISFNQWFADVSRYHSGNNHHIVSIVFLQFSYFSFITYLSFCILFLTLAYQLFCQSLNLQTHCFTKYFMPANIVGMHKTSFHLTDIQ